MPAAHGRVAIVDVDGTLVDSVYQHALTWHRAFAEADLAIPVWRCHRAIGMGGDQLVPELAGDGIERDRGEQLRDREGELFAELLGEVNPLPGAAELIRGLAGRGHTVVLASSGDDDEVAAHVNELGVGDDVAAVLSSGDVDASKPDPDLVESALAKGRAAAGDEADHDGPEGRPGGGGDDGVDDNSPASGAVMIGDSVWDVRAAERAGVDTIGLLTGGFSADELREAGAIAVYADPAALAAALDETPLA